DDAVLLERGTSVEATELMPLYARDHARDRNAGDVMRPVDRIVQPLRPLLARIVGGNRAGPALLDRIRGLVIGSYRHSALQGEQGRAERSTPLPQANRRASVAVVNGDEIAGARRPHRPRREERIRKLARGVVPDVVEQRLR